MYCISKVKKGCFLIALSAVAFTSCRKETGNGLNADDNGGYASDASRIEWINNDVISIADAAGSVYNAAYIAGINGCATVATDTSSIPHTLRIRFGTAGCTGIDGRVRKGTIIVTYNGRYTDAGQLHTITYDNYYINGHNMRGSIKTIRVDTTVAGKWYYKVMAKDSLNMSPDPLKSQYVVWEGNLVRRWVQGYGVEGSGDRRDDIFSISGGATLTRPNSHVFSFGISTPLQFALSCNVAQSGVVNVGGLDGARVLNYGDGGCDKNAKLNNGPAVYDILLTE
jgi:hypothetical protein